MQQRMDKAPTALLIVLAVYAVYLGVYIFRTSIVMNGSRYFLLTDDMMISMTYAKNLAAGHGLVWNAGGMRVEGITNPLWTLSMAVMHLLPLSPAKTSLAVQLTGGVLTIATVYAVYRIATVVSDSPLVRWGAAILTMTYSHLVYWNLMGNEVSVVTLLTVLAVLLVLRHPADEGTPSALYLLPGAAVLARIDMTALYLALWGFCLWKEPAHRRRHLLSGLAVLAFVLGGQTLFRLWYYGDPLPNTYYLKMTGYPALLRMATGLYSFGSFVWGMNIILLPPTLIFLAPFIILWKRLRDDRAVQLMVLVFAVQIAYSIYVGGDAWEERGGANRFISVAMPLFFVLLALAMERLIKNARVYAAVVAVIVLSLNGAALGELFLTGPFFQKDLNENLANYARLIDIVTTPGTSVALTNAGIVPYLADRHFIDQLGKCDPVIARTDVPHTWSWEAVRTYKPGHMKYDHRYVFGVRKPGFVSQLPGPERDIAREYLRLDYTRIELPSINSTLFFRKGTDSMNRANLERYFSADMRLNSADE